MADSEDSAPGVNIERIENVEDADIQVNRYTVEDGEVVEEEVDANVSGEDIEAIAAEVGDEIDSALDDFEVDMDVDSTPAPQTTPQPDEESGSDGADSSTSETIEEAAMRTQTGDEPDADDLSADDLSMDEATEIGREIISNLGLTVSDWSQFASAWRDRGVTDQSFMGDVWDAMKDEGVIGEAESVDFGSDDDAETDDTGDSSPDDGDRLSGSGDVDDKTTDDPTESGGASPDINFAEASMGEIFDDADQAHLAIRPSHEPSDEAIDQFQGLIQEDILNVLNIRTNIDGSEIIADAGIEEDDIPSVLLQYGGDYYSLDALVEGDQQVETDQGSQTTEEEQPDSEQDDSGGGGQTNIYSGLEGVNVGDDLLLLGDDEASAALNEELAGAIGNFEVIALPVDSEVAGEVIDRLDAEVTTPEYVDATDSGLEIKDIEILLNRYVE